MVGGAQVGDWGRAIVQPPPCRADCPRACALPCAGAEWFYQDKSVRGGLQSKCRVCAKQASNKYRTKNLEYYRKYSQKYRAEHPEKLKRHKQPEYSEQRLERGRKYYKDHHE